MSVKKKMLAQKYLKNGLGVDLIYRSGLKNSLSLSSFEKLSFSVPDASSLPKTLSISNVLKILSLKGVCKVNLFTASFNERSVKKGDSKSCTIHLSKRSTLAFISSYLFAMTSSSILPVYSSNLMRKSISFRLSDPYIFFPLSYYESSTSIPLSDPNLILSFHFSKASFPSSTVLFSLFFPCSVAKKNMNSFRAILREIEQSGLAH